MHSFLKFIDERFWVFVANGLSPPKVIDDGVFEPKPVELWTNTQLELANSKFRTIDAIFNVVSINQIKVIGECEIIVNDSCNKLFIRNEATKTMKK